MKCGYSGGMAKANVACMPKDDAAEKAAGLRVRFRHEQRVVRKRLDHGQRLLHRRLEQISAADYPDGAKCGYSGGSAKATVICSAGGADGSGIRVVSGSNYGACDSGETMVSVYCSGVGSEYPLQTYPNAAKCGYSTGKSQVTLLCAKL